MTAPASVPRDRKARAARILRILDERIPAPAIPLDHGDPFQLLVAVILSAQCTDARVNMVTPALFARAPDAHAMAQMAAAEIYPYVKTCGFKSKADNLAAMARALVAEHGGAVPRDMAALERLPGVGHKTASVVMVQAFDEPAFPVDTHIHRLAGRWQLSRARSVEEVERDLKAVFPRERWTTLHLQFIYFGREYCPAKGHVPAACPICSWAMSKARAARELRQGLSKPVMKTKTAKAARAAKTANTAAPANTAKTANTAAPAKTTNTAKTANTAAPANTANTANTAAPANTANTANTAKTAAPAAPAKTTKAAAPASAAKRATRDRASR